MCRIIYIIAAFAIAFTIIAHEQVFANATNQRDAVFAQQPDAIQGDGASRSHAVSTSDYVKENIGAKASTTNQAPNPGVPECAWKDANFQQAYLALASEQTSSTSPQGGSGAISQAQHIFKSGGDGALYERQNVSIAGGMDIQGSCVWVDTENSTIAGKSIYVDKYAVVFPDDYNYYEGEFKCNQPLVYFCSNNVEIGYNGFRNWKSPNAHAIFSNGNHLFSGEYAFGQSIALVTIGNGDHTFTGERVFQNAKGTVTIGQGSHIFGIRAFHSFEGIAKIGNSLPGEGHKFYGEKTFHSLLGTVEIGNGNHEFSGNEAFAYPKVSSSISIGDGDHLFTGNDAFRNASSTVIIGDGSHEFSGSGVFRNSKNTSYIEIGHALPGEGHTFSGEDSFYQASGIIDIGDGSHVISGGAFKLTSESSYVKIGQSLLGEGHSFIGQFAIAKPTPFYGSKGIVEISNGNHTFYKSFESTGPFELEIGEGNQDFSFSLNFDSNTHYHIYGGNKFFKNSLSCLSSGVSDSSIKVEGNELKFEGGSLSCDESDKAQNIKFFIDGDNNVFQNALQFRECTNCYAYIIGGINHFSLSIMKIHYRTTPPSDVAYSGVYFESNGFGSSIYISDATNYFNGNATYYTGDILVGNSKNIIKGKNNGREFSAFRGLAFLGGTTEYNLDQINKGYNLNYHGDYQSRYESDQYYCYEERGTLYSSTVTDYVNYFAGMILFNGIADMNKSILDNFSSYGITNIVRDKYGVRSIRLDSRWIKANKGRYICEHKPDKYYIKGSNIYFIVGDNVIVTRH